MDSDRSPVPPLLRTLLSRELLVVTGKGGVGKSVVSAALAAVIAASGRRVLLMEVDPRENLHQLFDLPPSGGEIVRAAERLYLQNLRPQRVLDELTREQIKIAFLARRVIESPVYRHFTEGAPGLEELAVLGHALRQVRRRTEPAMPDTVILDAPATGHGVSLLAAPALVTDVVAGGPFGQMARELAAFVSDESRAGILAVTLAEEMPVQEVIELLEMLRSRVGRTPDAIVVNGLYPAVPATTDDLAPALAPWIARRHANEREMARLAGAWAGPTVHLPLLPVDPGPALLKALSERLREAMREHAPSRGSGA